MLHHTQKNYLVEIQEQKTKLVMGLFVILF